MLDETTWIKKYLAEPKWQLTRAIVNTALQCGHKIELLVATADGGEAAGIPSHVVQGQFTRINVTPGATRYTVLTDETKSVDAEVRFAGKSTQLSIHVGVIAQLIVEGLPVPFQSNCWPIQSVAGFGVSEETIDGDEEPVDNVVQLFGGKQTH